MKDEDYKDALEKLAKSDTLRETYGFESNEHMGKVILAISELCQSLIRADKTMSPANMAFVIRSLCMPLFSIVKDSGADSEKMAMVFKGMLRCVSDAFEVVTGRQIVLGQIPKAKTEIDGKEPDDDETIH